MAEKDSKKYTELSNVAAQRNFLTAQEFPEGPYGSPFRKDEPVQNKSTPWKKGSAAIVPIIMNSNRFIKIYHAKWTVPIQHMMTRYRRYKSL